MAIDALLRKKVEAELLLGKTARELSEKYELPYITINSWQKKLQKKAIDDDIDTMVSTDDVTLHRLAEEIKASPMPVKEMKKSIKVIDEVMGLQRLEEKTRTLSMRILQGVEDFLDEIEKEGDTPDLKTLREAAGIVTALHTALFNKNTTNVNVLNNNTVSGEKLTMFKSSLGT